MPDVADALKANNLFIDGTTDHALRGQLFSTPFFSCPS